MSCLSAAAQGHGAETESPAARGGPAEGGAAPGSLLTLRLGVLLGPAASLLLPPGPGQARAQCWASKELNRTPPAQHGPRLRRALTRMSRRESEFLRNHLLDFAGQQEMWDVLVLVCTPVQARLWAPAPWRPRTGVWTCTPHLLMEGDGPGQRSPGGPHLGILHEPQGALHPSRRLLRAREGPVSLATASSEAAPGWTAGVALHSLLASQGGPVGQQGPAPGFVCGPLNGEGDNGWHAGPGPPPTLCGR